MSRRGGKVVVAVALAGCLGPQASDEVGRHPDIRAPGAAVPAADDDPRMRAQLDEHDGVGRTIELVNGFAAGAPAQAWDFGPAPAFAAPLFVLAARAPDGTLAPIAHNTIVDVIPGDPGYSPYWAVFLVELTDRYAGEQITSAEAVGAAVAEGLLLPPAGQDLAVNCPAVAPDVTLEPAAGAAPILPPARFYYRGVTVPYFDLGPMPLAADRVAVPEMRRFELRREGGEPLSEPVRGVDLVGDGDLDDTNDIFERASADARRSPLCRTVAVAVAPAIGSIDTSGDARVAELRAAEQLVDPAPVAGVVMAYAETDELRNCPAPPPEAP